MATLSPSPSPRATPLASPAPRERAASLGASTATSPALSTGGMTKEEKATEMVRGKEEKSCLPFFFLVSLYASSARVIVLMMRGVGFQRIAQLKEQKNAAGLKA